MKELVLKPFKGREVNSKQTYKVYRNLHKGAFSIVCKKEGVVAHGENFFMENVLFNVSEAGRQRVLRERCKNVHAYVIGTLRLEVDFKFNKREIYYNPYDEGFFYYKDNKEKVESANMIILTENKIFEVIRNG